MSIKILLLVGMALSPSVALGCDCVPTSVPQARKRSDVVFSGTIVKLSDWKVIFRVDRVWKGDIGPNFEMPAFSLGCMGFPSSNMLLVGNAVLVFALRDNHEYTTSICLPTSSVDEAADTLKKLGPGKPPRREKPQNGSQHQRGE